MSHRCRSLCNGWAGGCRCGRGHRRCTVARHRPTAPQPPARGLPTPAARACRSGTPPPRACLRQLSRSRRRRRRGRRRRRWSPRTRRRCPPRMLRPGGTAPAIHVRLHTSPSAVCGSLAASVLWGLLQRLLRKQRVLKPEGTMAVWLDCRACRSAVSWRKSTDFGSVPHNAPACVDPLFRCDGCGALAACLPSPSQCSLPHAFRRIPPVECLC